MNCMITAANKNFKSIGGNFTNFYRSASSVDSVSQEIYSLQAFYMPYTLFAAEDRLSLNDREYFEQRVLNVLVFSSEHNGMFFDE
jgi:hypothetical protein